MAVPDCPQKRPYVIKETTGEKWWCACGKSSTQPYCDGSHAGTEFSPVQVQVEEDKVIAWCGCKRSGNGPFCDGSHSGL